MSIMTRARRLWGNGRHAAHRWWRGGWVMALGLGAIPLEAEVLIAPQSVWKYWRGTSEASSPTSAWRSLGFDDSAWEAGQAPFYYDAERIYQGNTALDGMRYTYTCLFLRRTFVVDSVAAISTLELRSYCDDGFVLWINGTRVHAFNYTLSNYNRTNTATALATEPLVWSGVTLTNPAAYLVNGANQVAVQAFNRPITSSDFIIELELSSSAPDLKAPTVARVTPGAGTVEGLRQVTVEFSESVGGVSASDLLLNGIPALGVTGSGSSYTFAFGPLPLGRVAATWDPGAWITDFASPPNTFVTTGPGATWEYDLVDRQAPAIEALVPAAGTVVRQLQQVSVTFTEPVTGVDAADLRIDGVGATRVTGSLAGPYIFEFPARSAGPVALAWAPDSGIADEAVPANAFGGGSWTVTVDPSFVVSTVRINEILTAYSGVGGLRDEDDELQDWIELRNSGTTAVRLLGWALTDDPDDPGQWTFPDVSIGPGQHLVVFASGKDRKPTAPGSRLHTNFKLNSAGDYLGLYDAESPRQRLSAFAPEFPEQRSDHSYGYDSSSGLRYFAVPTPGAANGASTIIGVVPPVHENVSRGFFERPFSLVLTCPMAGAAIRYTTDGSEPTQGSGELYAGPVTISVTTVLRAAAFLAGHLPSAMTTCSYVFPDQVIAQPNNPPGVPTTWIDTQNRTWTADYEMDPEITQDPQYRDLLKPALLALPVLSVVMRPEDLFDNSTGIYPKSQNRGASWERPCSVELFFPDGREGFQIECGIQCQGNSVRDPVKTPKHAFRLVFKGDYGPAKLRHPFFPDSTVSTFDTLTLRADFNFSWLHWSSGQRPRGQRCRDAFLKDSLRAMGGLSGHNRFVHLYLNGLYWGVYDPTERPDGAFGAAYLGGEKEDYDVVNEGSLVDGNMTAYNAMLAINDLADTGRFQQMEQYLDVGQYIDYILLHFYVGHEDWGQNKNWYTMRRRVAGAGFKYVPWDGENIMAANTANRVSNSDTASGLHTKLVANAQYRLDFADHVQRHCFDGGALTPEVVGARWQRWADVLDIAIVAESARWGDYRRDVHSYSSGPYELYTRNQHWLVERDRLLKDYFPVRTGILVGQLKSAGLYPANAVAPVLSHRGGPVAAGLRLTLSAASGSLIVTTNGLDPRVRHAGTIDPSAWVYREPLVIDRSLTVKARTLLGAEWSALVEATFQVAELGSPLRITEIMYHPAGGDPYEFIELQNTGSTTIHVGGYAFEGIDYTFPPGTTLGAGARIVLASGVSPDAFAQEYPGVPVFGYFGLSLANGGERLVLRDAAGAVATAVEYGDGGGWPTAADGSGSSLEVLDPRGDPDAPANWQASARRGGSPGAATVPMVSPSVVLSEIMADNVASVPAGAGFPDWIEVHNPTGAAVDLSGWGLSDDSDPRFVFPAGTLLDAGGYLVVWCGADETAPGHRAGFALARKGETVSLFDASGRRVDSVTFGLQLADRSLGRVAGAGGLWQLCEPTPGVANRAHAVAVAARLRLNEWLPNPVTGQAGWVEIYNADVDLPAVLKGLYVAAGGAVSRLEALAFLPPGGFVVLGADLGGDLRLPFRLPESGGTLALYDGAGVGIDQVVYSGLELGTSAGRLPDGGARVEAFPGSSSPGAPNHRLEPSGLVLNEVMAWNAGVVTNAAGGTPDWVELYNPAPAPAALDGLSLGLGEAGLDRWFFPRGLAVPAEGWLTIWCDGTRPISMSPETPLNAGEGLGRDGGVLVLYNALGQALDRIAYGAQVRNRSLGRAQGEWQLLEMPTPGAENSGPAFLGDGSNLRINEWLASSAAGGDWVELYNADNLPVALAGLTLTDLPGMAGLQQPPFASLDYVDAGGFVCVRSAEFAPAGAASLGFGLSREGDALVLLGNGGEWIDAVFFGSMALGTSLGRLPDGAESVVLFPEEPTPGGPNGFRLRTPLVSEVLPQTASPLEAAIELHNPEAAPVDIGGWYLSDDPADPRKFRIPEGTEIGAGAFCVFYRHQFDGGTGSLVPFGLESGRGETAVLSAADASGNLTGWRDVMSAGVHLPGVSFGRYLTSQGSEVVPWSWATFGVDRPENLDQFRQGQGASNAPPRVGPLVISEIHYHPVATAGGSGEENGASSQDEFIELQNITERLVVAGDRGAVGAWRIRGGVDLDLPGGVAVAPGGFVVLVSFDPQADVVLEENFRVRHAVPAGVPLVGPWNGRLDNAGESLRLEFADWPAGVAVPEGGIPPFLMAERIGYCPDAPWPDAADGDGASLQRRVAGAYGNDPANWHCAPPTPGRASFAPLLRLSAVTEAGVHLGWASLPGRSYRVQFRGSLVEGAWLDLGGDIVADSLETTAVDLSPALEGARYYRVILIGD
ncbi:MAG TPA: lamin tail domain-containing protein [Verrucomicrobiota bacterium]|nr:lamin tail domain-containing protein [Verrucomicrobiota bacterium]